MSYRARILELAPPWLRASVAGRTLYAAGVTLDAIKEWATQGILARMPLVGTSTALPALSRDRVMVRGFDEATAHFRQRLTTFLAEHRLRGHAFGIMRAVAGYLSPHPVRLRVVTNSGMWYTRESDGEETWQRVTPNDWDWDGDTSWARFWLVIYPGDTWTEETDWGNPGEVWGDTNGTWGTSAQLEHVKVIRGLVQTWKAAHMRCEWIVVAFDDASFDPDEPSETDGEWGPWSKDDPRTNSRIKTARYWDGVS